MKHDFLKIIPKHKSSIIKKRDIITHQAEERLHLQRGPFPRVLVQR